MTSNRIRRRTFLAGAVAALATPLLPRSAMAQAKSIKAAWIRQFAPAGLVQKGADLAKAEGLDVELVGFSRALDGLVAMQKGDVVVSDCLLGYSHLCLALSQGIDVTMISGSNLGLNAILIAPRVLAKGQIDDKNKAYIGPEPWKHLAGKKIGMARGSQAEFLTRAYMKTHGMDLDKDAQFVDLKTNADQALALQQGSVDVAVLIEPSATQSRMAGHGVLLSYPYDAGPFAKLNGGIIVRTDALKQYADELQRLVNAHVKAIQLYQADRTALVNDTAKVTLFDVATMTHLLNPQSLGLDPKYWINLEFDFRMPKKAIEQYAKTLFESGGIPKDVSGEVGKHLDYTMLAKATKMSVAELGG
jgi:ABC-type nitrate/sulfonate/bicarbonate transport system substrate-binding protein